MLGVVACETLYHELARSAPGAAVEFVPQWLHEFPIHPPESERIHRAVETKVAALERQGVDEILVLYRDPEGLAGIETTEVPLHVYRGGDCIDLFLPDQSRHRFEPRKAAHTYFLTRGWIDVGLDCYKLYAAYTGELESLVEDFQAARAEHPEIRVSWPESDHLTTVAERRASMRTAPEALMRPVVQWFHRVLLVDTGDLLPFHYAYARAFRSFLADLGTGEAERTAVPLAAIEGDRGALEALLADPSTGPDVETFPAGTPVTAEAVEHRLDRIPVDRVSRGPGTEQPPG